LVRNERIYFVLCSQPAPLLVSVLTSAAPQFLQRFLLIYNVVLPRTPAPLLLQTS
jgi:hypothetical protein